MLRHRLHAQLLARPRSADPAAVVAAIGPIQAQDYAGGKWAVGVRTRGAIDADVERALTVGSIVRTHPLRGTLHFVAASDVRWILALTAPTQIARAASRSRELGLDERIIARSQAVLARALAGGAQLDRRELAAVLRGAKIATDGQRLVHLIYRAELDGVVCSGARRGKQLLFAALDDRVPAGRPRPRDEAIAELARRYFTTRGPATASDFAWWSGLPAADARAGLAAIVGELADRVVAGVTYWSSRDRPDAPRDRAYLLPPWDEYAVAYRDRAVLSARGGVLAPIIVFDGRVIGTWSRELGKTTVAIAFAFHEVPSKLARRAIELAADRYASFLEMRRP